MIYLVLHAAWALLFFFFFFNAPSVKFTVNFLSNVLLSMYLLESFQPGVTENANNNTYHLRNKTKQKTQDIPKQSRVSLIQ